MQTVFSRAPFQDPPFVDTYPIWTCAYHDFREVVAKNNSVVNLILRHMPFVGGRQFIGIDVRLQYLRPTDWTSAFDISDGDGWHKDTERDPDAIHHIYVIGKNRTEFLIQDQVVELPLGCYATYDSQALHRGVQAKEEEYRLFIRGCETNDPTVMRVSMRDAYPERYIDTPEGVERIYLSDEEIEEIFPDVWK